MQRSTLLSYYLLGRARRDPGLSSRVSGAVGWETLGTRLNMWKYCRQNLILSHPQPGLQLPAIPMRKDTHCIDKRFGNLPLSFMQIFSTLSRNHREMPGTGKFRQTVQKFPGMIPVKVRKRKYLERYYLFTENIPPGWAIPFEFSPELPKIQFGKWSVFLG